MKKSLWVIITAALSAAVFQIETVKKTTDRTRKTKQKKSLLSTKNVRVSATEAESFLSATANARMTISGSVTLLLTASSPQNYSDTLIINGREAGQSGIEKLIDQRKTSGSPVRLSLDCKIQHNLEKNRIRN